MRPPLFQAWFVEMHSTAAEKAEAKRQAEVILVAEKRFKSMDIDNNGVLDSEEVLLLADWLWVKYHPYGKALETRHQQTLAQSLTVKVHTNEKGVMTLGGFFAWSVIHVHSDQQMLRHSLTNKD